METTWKRDILGRAEAAMLQRHEGDHRAAVDRMIERDKRTKREQRKDLWFAVGLAATLVAVFTLSRCW